MLLPPRGSFALWEHSCLERQENSLIGTSRAHCRLLGTSWSPRMAGPNSSPAPSQGDRRLPFANRNR